MTVAITGSPVTVPQWVEDLLFRRERGRVQARPGIPVARAPSSVLLGAQQTAATGHPEGTPRDALLTHRAGGS